jgi:hypothetical protein
MFPESDLPAIRRCFFGFDAFVSGAVLTPSSMIFEKLSVGMPRVCGWWPTARAARWLMCRTPQSTGVVDAVAALWPETETTFVGLCGSLRGHKIGEIIEPERARLNGAAFPRSYARAPEYQSVDIATVRCLADGITQAPELQSVAGVIDMETAHVFRTAQLLGLSVRALLVVSDAFPGNPFFDPGISAKPIEDSLSRLAAQLRSSIAS